MQKERTQVKINLLSEQLQKIFSKMPKRPRDTREQMDEKIAKLEYERTTTSLSLAKEKSILRQIDVIKRSKVQLEEYEEHEILIQEKKSEIAALKESLRITIAAIAEIETALSKVELAKRLGCTPAELKTRVVDCPEDRLGQVIGKNGIGLKQLEERTGVLVDVDKVGFKIHMQGSDAALDAAVEEVENITLAVEEELKLSSAVVSYLLANRSALLNKMQEEHPNVYLDLDRESTIVRLRGRPEKVSAAKAALLGLDVKCESRALTSREISLVVGKGGATINKLVESYNVVINIDGKDTSATSVEVVGMADNVDAAYQEIDKILYDNEEIDDEFVVDQMVRNNFLADSGVVMKELQADISKKTEHNGGGVLLQFEKRPKEEQHKSESKLLVKASRLNMPIAKEVIQKKISEVEANVLTITVDPDMIPTIIGKGGSTINELRKEGTGADIEVDKITGKIKIQGDEEVKQAVTKAIDKIVSENQVLKVEIDKSMIGVIFGEPGKEMKAKVMDEIGAALLLGGDENHIILRGTDEQINGAADILREFISNNYTEECDILEDDEVILIAGGTESFRQNLEQEHDVKINLRKAKHAVAVRGKKENVQAAVKELNQFLRGGNGFAVFKMKIAEGVVGIVIGKGGSNLAKLESEYEGVSVNVHHTSNCLSIRGPEEKVAACRVAVVKTISTARVSETVSITMEQYDTLAKPEVMRRITDGIPVQVTKTENSIKLRGTAIDVRDAKALLQEQLNGTYEGIIDLEPSQLSKVRNAVRDPSHFERIRNATGAEINLEAAESVIVIKGKRSSVKKAKNLMFGLLDFLLPSEFAKLKVAKPQLRFMGDVSALAEIAANSGASVCLDRDLLSILVRSPKPESVNEAMILLNERLEECEKLNYVERFDASDAWLLSKIIGRGGMTVQKLQDDTGCKIDVAKEERTVAILGESEEAVEKARAAFNEVVEKARRECIFMDIPESAMPAFIGKSGGHIRQLAEENSVEIERLRKEPNRIRIQGDEVSVRAASVVIGDWLKEWENKNVGTTIPIEEAFIPAILGKDGSAISAIQKDTGCRIDIDRKALTLTVRGGPEANKAEALQKIEAIIGEEKSKALERGGAVEEERRKSPEIEPRSREVETGPSKKEEQKAVNVQGHEARKDRSKEFAPVPVGLTIVEKNNSKKNRNKQKPDANTKIVEEKPQGSTAGRELFNMLLSNSAPTGEFTLPKNEISPTKMSVTVPDEQWDSSTVSSAAASSGTENDESLSSEAQLSADKPYFKSASGFSVRI